MAGSTITLGLIIKASANAAHGALQSLGQNIERMKGRVREAELAHARLGEKLALLGRQGRPIAGLSDAYVKLGKTIEAARLNAERLAATQERIAGHRAAMGELWGQAMGVAGMALSLGAPVKVAADFERSMARVGAVSRASAEDLRRLTATARELGARTSFSASQAAEGMQYLAMAGFSVDQTISAMPGMLNLAAAGAIDLGRAADIASNILTGFGLSADEMGRVGDVLVNTFTRSNVDLNMLGESMKYAAPVARALGLSIEETAAMVGKLGDAGIQGSMAGTALRAMLLRLSSERGAVQKELQAYGIAIADAQGNLKSLPSLLAEIQAKTSHLGSQEAAKVLSQIFGQEAVGAALALMEQASSGALQTLIDQTQEAGAAQRVAADMTRNAHGEWTRLKSVLESISITLGNTLLPVLTELLQAVQTRVLQPLDAWMSRNERLVGVIAKAAAALLAFKAGALVARAAYHGLAMSALGTIGGLQKLRGAWLAASLAIQTRSLAPMLGTAAPAAAGLAARLREIATSGAPLKAIGWHIRAMGASAAASATAIGGTLKAALLAAGKAVLWLGRAVMLNPIGLVLTGAALLIYKFWGPISGFFKGLWSGLRQGLAMVREDMRKAFAPAMPLLRPLLAGLEWLGGKLKAVVGWLGAFIQPMEDAGGAARSLGERVGLYVAAMVKTLLGLPAKLLGLPVAMLKIGADLVQGLIDGIKSKLAAVGEAVKGLGSRVVSGLKSLLGIRSPSRVFAELGGFVAEGFAGGVMGKSAMAHKAIGGLAAASVALAVPAFGATKSGPGAAAAPMQITFAPQIAVTGAASPEAARAQVTQAVQMSFAEFERLMRRYEHERRRIAP